MRQAAWSSFAAWQPARLRRALSYMNPSFITRAINLQLAIYGDTRLGICMNYAVMQARPRLLALGGQHLPL